MSQTKRHFTEDYSEDEPPSKVPPPPPIISNNAHRPPPPPLRPPLKLPPRPVIPPPSAPPASIPPPPLRPPVNLTKRPPFPHRPPSGPPPSGPPSVPPPSGPPLSRPSGPPPSGPPPSKPLTTEKKIGFSPKPLLKPKGGFGIAIKLGGAQKSSKESEKEVKKTPKVASVFNTEDSSDEEEMPVEAKMRMRNVGRETITSSGPNSFGKTKQGFTDTNRLFERQLKEAMDKVSNDTTK